MDHVISLVNVSVMKGTLASIATAVQTATMGSLTAEVSQDRGAGLECTELFITLYFNS